MMTMARRKDIHVHQMPEETRRALIADAQEQGVSINEVASVILAETFKTKHVPSGRGFRPGDYDSQNMSLRVGAVLHRRIALEAAKRGGTLRGIVLEALATHYGLEPVSVKRLPKGEG